VRVHLPSLAPAIIAPMPDPTPITTLLIANRGEIAVRVIRAARELGLRTIAIYGNGEHDALHVRLADDAWRISSPAAIPYLDIPAILDVAQRAGADAIHPGYGFLAENSTFAAACAETGIVFVGPPAAAIAAMGDKIEARRIAAAAGVPIVAGSDGTVASVADALAWGAAHGYPVAVKASGGGGGRGFRVARGPEEMETAFLGASGEAARSFANPEVYLERYLDDPRHIEIQLMADTHGSIVAVGDRDCSVQRRHQKLLEEAPAPGIPAETRRAMAEAAIALARAVAYRGAGTVEFLLDDSGDFAFLEMNTRIQVEHPVTEMTTGIDLVREQLLVAADMPLSFTEADVAPQGHAIECRINAEDPGRGFAPVPGTITAFRAPAGMGVRVDSAAESGFTVHPAYDSLIAKVVAWGRDRAEATARMQRALTELSVEGIPTTRAFHQRLLVHPAWQTGQASTTFLDRHPEVIPPPAADSSAPAAPAGAPAEVIAEVDRHRFQVRLHGDYAPASTSQQPSRRPPPPSQSASGRAADGVSLRSPIQGTVVRVTAAAGDTVTRGQIVCVIEAMKMENDVAAHRDGVLTSLSVAPGMAIRVGDPIAEIG
jgi:acetyl-CoA/propionyl-CoA carboxylase biotin carboxyl carrier protein